MNRLTTKKRIIRHSVGVDAEGNVYGSVVRRRMLEKHVPRR